MKLYGCGMVNMYLAYTIVFKVVDAPFCDFYYYFKSDLSSWVIILNNQACIVCVFVSKKNIYIYIYIYIYI